MLCCTGYCAAEAQFDRTVAERDLRRYRRRGADATTRLMLAELRRWSLEGRRLMDVGGGIGVISRELAGTGVASATIVEASPAYLEVARREAGPHYGTRPARFILGDFAVIAGTLPEADVVTLGPRTAVDSPLPLPRPAARPKAPLGRSTAALQTRDL
jgi:SAM-dependent methyltransferase